MSPNLDTNFGQPIVANMTDYLVRVVAPHFVAGIVTDDDLCLEAAPILRWAIGRDNESLRSYFDRKGWQYSACGTPSEQKL